MLKWWMRFPANLVVVMGVLSGNAWADEALFKAIESEDTSAMSTLFLRGSDPNARNAQGQVPLYVALRGGQFRAVNQLMSHPDLKIDLANAAGETPLMMAALKGYTDWVDRLLAKGAQINRDGWTPLHYAAAGPSVEVVKRLVEKGARLDALSPNGTTPLMMAARYGAQDAAEWLLQRGADAGLRNEQGLSAAEFARLAGREKLQARLTPAVR